MLSAAPSDEVVEVFTGDTLEEAMAFAVASLGPDLAVRRARRVRKGVQGLRGKDRYEVVAVPPPRTESDPVAGAFEALLQQAEQIEEGAPADVIQLHSTPAPSTEVRPALAPTPAAERPAWARPVIPPPRAAAPATPRGQAAPRPARPAAARPRPTPRPAGTAEGWSRRALTRLGLPKRLLAQLPDREPRGDLAWVKALERAFSALVPAPDPSAAVTVSGTGLPGVLGILDAARKGLAVGTITYEGRTAPATATELALAVRAELLR